MWAALHGVLEAHTLLRQNASFAEHFYALHRVTVRANGGGGDDAYIDASNGRTNDVRRRLGLSLLLLVRVLASHSGRGRNCCTHTHVLAHAISHVGRLLRKPRLFIHRAPSCM